MSKEQQEGAVWKIKRFRIGCGGLNSIRNSTGLEQEVKVKQTSPNKNPNDKLLESNHEVFEERVVNQLGTTSSCHISVIVEGKKANAVIDTGSDVTLISEQIYQSMSKPLPLISRVVLRTAGRDLTMKGSVVGPANVCIGNLSFNMNLFVAPLESEMLLGKDFFSKHGVRVDFQSKEMVIGSSHFPFTSETPDATLKSSAVQLPRRTVLPPNAVCRIQCEMDEHLEHFMVEPSSTNKYLIPRTLHANTDQPALRVFNCTDNFYVPSRSGRDI